MNTIDHIAEEEYLSQVEIERYWLSQDNLENLLSITIGYYKDIEDARKAMMLCVKNGLGLHYTLIDLESGECVPLLPTDFEGE